MSPSISTAFKNEVSVLRALSRFGFLRTKDIAYLVWTRWQTKATASSPSFHSYEASPSALRMAQRTLKRMRTKKLVLFGKAPNGSVVYALAEAGARRLTELGHTSESGKDVVRDFSSAFFRHRCIANEVAITAICDGFKASTEREIAKGRWIGKDGVSGKKPDVLIRSGNALWWVEVENSRKNKRDYQALLVWLSKALASSRANAGRPQLLDSYYLEKCVFICSQQFKAKLEADLIASGWMASDLAKLVLFETSLYSKKEIYFF